MTETKENLDVIEDKPVPLIHVAPSPHMQDKSLTTRRMMIDVLIGLAPLMVAAVIVFRMAAVVQVAVCVFACMVTELIFTAMRRKPFSLTDCSAIVTGIILAFSLPWNSSIYVTTIGAFMAIGLGKIIFGGLGFNLFNPAMVGRAFVMLAFSAGLAAPAFVAENIENLAPIFKIIGVNADVITSATPMTVFKEQGVFANWFELFLGNTNGCLGETSALACILGGLYLCLRRTASWEIPAGSIIAVVIIAGIMSIVGKDANIITQHLLGGAFLFGVFFIATDPVTSPLTSKGKLIFGLVFGALVMFIREYSGYPEGVMFSILLVNAIAPLINRWTVPIPFGGPVPVRK